MGFGSELSNIGKRIEQEERELYMHELNTIPSVKNALIDRFKVRCELVARNEGAKQIAFDCYNDHAMSRDDYYGYSSEYRDLAEKLAMEIHAELQNEGFKKLKIELRYFKQEAVRYSPPSFFHAGGNKKCEVKFYTIVINARW